MREIYVPFIPFILLLYSKSCRNVPTDNQSLLLPYLHYGMISPMEVMRKMNKSDVDVPCKSCFEVLHAVFLENFII